MLQPEHIEVERTGPGSYRLRWPAGSGALEVHTSLQPDALAVVAAQVTVAADGAEIGNLPAAARYFFHLRGADGQRLVVADRHVPLQGARNFRDFGGYTTAAGQSVRWGRLYRSGHLGTLTELDQQHLTDLGIRLICDFRRDTERDGEPNRLGQNHQPRIENLPIAPGNTSSVFLHVGEDGRASSAEDVAQYMVEVNRDLALQQRGAYRRMFDAILAEDGPLLIHCAVGKDRTGFAAALILAVLGVPEATILRDYLLTSRYLPPLAELDRMLEKYPSRLAPAYLLPLLEARDVYLLAALGAIREQYGDMDSYLRDYLGIDAATRAELRGRLLQA